MPITTPDRPYLFKCRRELFWSVVPLLTALAIMLCGLSQQAHAETAGSRGLWDSSLANQPAGSQAQSKDDEADLLEKAKATLMVAPREAAQLPEDLRGEFSNARLMTVPEYLKMNPRAAREEEYRVGGMDVISVRVFDEPELSRDDIRVSTEGNITLPLIGQINVTAKSPREIERIVEKRYMERGFLREPHVTVQLKEFRSRRVLVMGAVNSPGGYFLEGNEQLLEILAKAGGIKFDDKGEVSANSIRLLRSMPDPGGQSQRISMIIDLESLTKGSHPEYNLRMSDKDVVYVPEAPRFFVTGEVRQPGYYKLKNRPISVVEAITMAGGLTDKAAGNRTRVVRLEKGKEITISVPVNDVLSGDKNKDTQIIPNDVIVVPQSLF